MFISEVLRTQEIIKSGEWVLESIFSSSNIPRLKKFQAMRDEYKPVLPRNTSIFVLTENEIIFQKIFEEPRFNSIDFPDNIFQKIDNTYLYSFSKDENRFIFYTSEHRGTADLLEDILILLLLVWVSWGLFYFIWYKFVRKALLPVEQNLADMQDFVHNAGHELKTPLAVMRGNLQIMSAEKSFDEELITGWIKNVDTMNGLIEGLIDLSEIWKSNTQDFFSLKSVLQEVLEEYSGKIKEKDINLSMKQDSKFSVRANKYELHMMLANLVSNAIKYTPNSWDITITLKKNIFIVADSGPGIPEIEQEKIFWRFYQAENARSSEWFWIGLSLVKKISDAYGWKVSVKSEVWKGSSFKVIF